jgi:hypothetical protein
MPDRSSVFIPLMACSMTKFPFPDRCRAAQNLAIAPTIARRFLLRTPSLFHWLRARASGKNRLLSIFIYDLTDDRET